MAAPRTGKSGMVADRILDHPGPVLATSTRADLYESTAGARACRGPVYVFNPQGVGGVPSTLKWDLLGPCRDLVMARRMAAWLKVPGIGGDLQVVPGQGRRRPGRAAVGRRGDRPHDPGRLRVGAAARPATCLEILATTRGSTRQMFATCQADVRGEPDLGQHPRHDRPHAVLGDPARPGRGGHPGAGRGLQRGGLHPATAARCT